MILARKKLPKIIEIDFMLKGENYAYTYTGPNPKKLVGLDNRLNMYKKLQDDGFINFTWTKVKKQPLIILPGFEMGLYEAELTDSGKRYALGQPYSDPRYKDSTFIKVKACSYEFDEITGIRDAGPNAKFVDLRLKIVQTPFSEFVSVREMCYRKDNIMDVEILFELYDDGWRCKGSFDGSI
jgi:hypothetical protein